MHYSVPVKNNKQGSGAKKKKKNTGRIIRLMNKTSVEDFASCRYGPEALTGSRLQCSLRLRGLILPHALR